MRYKLHELKVVAESWYNYLQMLRKRDKNKIISFKDKHKGQRIFCVGAGPSLNKENLELLRNEIVIFTNSSYKLLKKISPKTSYWLVQDNDRVREFIDADTSQFSCVFKSFHMLSNLNIKAYQNCTVLWPKITIRRYRSIIPYPHVIYNYYSFSEKLEERIDLTGSSVIFSAIQLAYYLGASKIALLGVDMNYTPDVKSSYFDYSPNRVYYEPGTHETYLTERKPFFKFYKDFLSEKGIEIYNCTCETKEDEFPKVSLEYFIYHKL